MGDGLIRARDVKPERIEWLWRERIPRKMITVVAGRPDQGKGLFCVHVAADLTRQGLHVLYSAAEDSHGIMTRPRLEAAEADLSLVLLLDGNRSLRLPEQMSELEAYIRGRKIDVVMLDPFAEHLSEGITAGSDSVRKVTGPLKKLLETTGAGCIVVEHALKKVPRGGHPLQAIRGNSSGLVAAARMCFVFGIDSDDEDARMLCHVKGNIRDKPPAIRFQLDVRQTEESGEQPALLYDAETVFDPMRLFASDKRSSIGRPPDKRAAACEWLTNYLYDAGKPVPAGTVKEDAKQVGMSHKTLMRAATEMHVVKDPPGGGKFVVWSLPDEVLEALEGTEGSAEAAEEELVSDAELNAFLSGLGGSDESE